jgi:hypothetical protein
LLARDELAAYEVGQRFYEIGTPTGLEETRRYLAGASCATQFHPISNQPQSIS